MVYLMLRVRKKLPHTVPQWVDPRSWFFITINCLPRGQNHLCIAGVASCLFRSIEFNNERHVWSCRLCLLMPDHLHGIFRFCQDPGMTKSITSWKSFTAKNGPVHWQRDFFDHRLRNEQELEETISYILWNPVRKGLCKSPEEWPWVLRAEGIL